MFILTSLSFLRMKEERVKKKSEGASEVLSLVSRSRKLEEKKNSEKEKALLFSKMFEEQVSLCLICVLLLLVLKRCLYHMTLIIISTV